MADTIEGIVRVGMDSKPIVEESKKAADALANLEKKGSASVASLEKRLEEASQKSVARIKRDEEILKREAGIYQKREAAVRSTVRAKGRVSIAEQEAKAETRIRVEEAKRQTILLDAEQKRGNMLFRAGLRNRQRTVEEQLFAADAFRARNPNYANMRGGGGGFFGGIGRRLSGLGGGGVAGSLIGGLAGGFGLGIGGYALANAVQGTVGAAQAATAYERQKIAAENLAGSQQKLNGLIDAYTKASGGAIDKVTTLANVTRLLSTGYAETVPEVERFVRATRGASIALGKPQEYVIQETQLAISNVSIKRLDQIGLGITEVNDRIEELRQNNAGWNREMAFQEAVLSLMEEKYGALTETVEGQATEVERLGKAWRDLGLAFGDTARGPLNSLSRGLRNLLDAMSPEDDLPPGESISQRAWRRDRRFSMSGFTGVSLFDLWGGMTGRTGTQIRAQHAFDSGMYGNRPASGYIGGPEDSDYNRKPYQRPEEQMTVLRDYYDQFAKLEEDYADARLEQIQQYERQRASIVSNFNRQMVREEEDFNRQRARSQRDYERSVLELMQDAQEREADWQEDLDERLADVKEDSADRIAEIEKDYHKDRERAEADHRDRLLKAAGQLDAIAVLEERKRWKRENQEREEAHQEAVAKQREALQEQIEDALEAHAKRVEDAREADAKRLEDMRSDRARQLADEDEDRAIRNQRAKEDHDAQLAELDRQHEETMTRLAEEAEDQRKALEDALAKDLVAVGEYVKGYHAMVAEKDRDIEKWFDKIILQLEKVIEKDLNRMPAGQGRGGLLETYPEAGFASGGPVGRTGPAMLHAGEYVLSRDMLAAGFTPSGGNSYNNRSVTIQSGAIAVTTTPGMEYMVGELLEQELVKILERV